MPIKNWTPKQRAAKRAQNDRWRKKPEVKLRKAAYARKYYWLNRQKLLAYQAKLQLQRIAARPPKPICLACQNSTNFAWLKGQWCCVPCRTRQSQTNFLLRNRRYLRRRVIRRRTAHLLKTYGQHVADAYAQYASQPNARLHISLVFIKTLCLPEQARLFTKDTIQRIHLLNDLAKAPFGNIGWACSQCPTQHTSPHFFDIDHVVPRSSGGRGGRANLQILCPNCHRLKTTGEHQLRRKILLERKNASQPQPVSANA